ncbi:hypothetical protein LEMLEM_LOCUS26944 [Lemmus lemmus]
MMCRPIEGGPKAKKTLLLRCNGTKPSEVQRQHQGRDIFYLPKDTPSPVQWD